MIELSNRHIEDILEIISTHAPQAEFWAYGSRVRGGAHEASDLDLVIRNTTQLNAPISNLVLLRYEFEESSLPFLVELHDWSQLPDEMQQEISHCHHVLWPAAARVRHSE